MRAATVTRSRDPAAVSRSVVTCVTAMSATVLPETSTGVTTVPAGSSTSSRCAHPTFWKSLMSTTSRCGRFDPPSTCAANLRAGAYRVPSEVMVASSMARSRRAWSPVGSVTATGSCANSTTVARSLAPRSATAACAAATARFQWSPYPMLYDWSSRTMRSRAPANGAPVGVARSRNGRANAATSSTSAVRRSASSNRWRSF